MASPHSYTALIAKMPISSHYLFKQSPTGPERGLPTAQAATVRRYEVDGSGGFQRTSVGLGTALFTLVVGELLVLS